MERSDDPGFYDSLIYELYTQVLGLVEGVNPPDDSERIVGVGMDSQNNIIIRSPPRNEQFVFDYALNLSRLYTGAVSVTRDVLLNQYYTLENSRPTPDSQGIIHVADSIFPNEIIHFTAHPLPVVAKIRPFIEPLLDTIIPGENFVVKMKLEIENRYIDLLNVTPLIFLPEGVELVSITATSTKTYNDLPISTHSPDNDLEIYWTLRATSTGIFEIPFLFNATESDTMILTTSFPAFARFGVKQSRLEITALASEIPLVPSDSELVVQANYRVISSVSSHDFTMGTIVLDYKFGNPGGEVSLEDVRSNVSHSFKQLLPIIAESPGTIGILMIYGYKGENDFWGETYVRLRTYPVRLGLNATLSRQNATVGEPIVVTIQATATGVDAARNITLNLDLEGAMISNVTTIKIDQLPPSTTQQVQFTVVPTSPGVHKLIATAYGDNIPSSRAELRVEVNLEAMNQTTVVVRSRGISVLEAVGLVLVATGINVGVMVLILYKKKRPHGA